MTSKFDIVVFGATGYAGQYVVEHLANPKSNIEGLTWAVAGRNAGKLAETLRTVGSWVDRDLSTVERIVANVDDEESLNAMCSRTRCLINCVGPYSLYGEPVVRAAINNNCHHIDLSGEELYLKSTALNYNQQAKVAKVFIVVAAGCDSAICDMGIEFLTQNSPYQLNGVSCYLVPHMPSLEHNFGTWYSLVTAVHDWRRIGEINRALFPKPLPEPRFKMTTNWPVSFRRGNLFNRWVLLFPVGDREIARWTQYYKYTVKNKRPIQIENYICPERSIQVFGGGLTMINVALLSLCSLGRNLLVKYPEFFSFGVFKSDGPNRDALLNRSFEMIFEGEAFEGKGDYGSLDEPTSPPTKKIACRISGPDPGYITCASCLVQAAVVLLKERDKLPGGVNGGGVFTPGIAFGRTGYIERLQKHGIAFEML